VIDPSLEVERYREIASAHRWTITHVLDTHLHADHISGARELVAKTGAALWLNPSDPFDFDFAPLTDGRVIELAPGVHLSVSAVSVPGHTEGSTMYQLGNAAIFTGDTLFLESVGRSGRTVRAQSLSQPARTDFAPWRRDHGLSRPLRAGRCGARWPVRGPAPGTASNVAEGLDTE
jgi:glyoxylase-like metal-dependent hydrolase (beta-lactamase superfamily II)